MRSTRIAINAILIVMIAITPCAAISPEEERNELSYPTSYVEVQIGEANYLVSTISSEVIIETVNGVKKFGNPIAHYAFQGFQPFTYNGRLLAIGGYGFWRINPFLLEFDTITGWNPHKLGVHYIPATDSHIYVTGDTLIVFGGRKLKDNLIDFERIDRIQYINLITKKSIFSKEFTLLHNASILAEKDANVLLKNDNGYFLINLKSIIIKRLEVNAQNIYVFEKPQITKISENEIEINNLSIPFIPGSSSIKFVTPVFVLIAILISLIILIFFIKKSNKIIITEKQSNEVSLLDSKERELISFLSSGPKLMTELHELFPSELSQSHKTKLVRDMVNNINIKSITFGQELVLVGNDEIDSRRKVFYLNNLGRNTVR